jgi:formate-dependent nitrite reductase membrane component NrfD
VTEFTEPVRWGYPTLIHFFLAGMGGGTLAISSLLLLWGRRHNRFFSVARYAAFIAPVVVFDDAVVLVLELGRPSRFLNIFKHVNFESPLWVGAWLMTLFLVISLVYAYTYIALPDRPGKFRRFLSSLGVPERVGHDRGHPRLRRALAIVGIPLGIAVCHYPGFMMSGLVARPLWSTSLFPTVFLFSGIATGLAATVLCRILFRRGSDRETATEYRGNNDWLMVATIVALLAEAFVLAQMVVHALNTHSDLQNVVEDVVMRGGLFTYPFWIGVVGIGFAGAIVSGLVVTAPRLLFSRPWTVPRSVEAIMPTAVLTGAVMLIYVLLFGGQLTGPMGF